MDSADVDVLDELRPSPDAALHYKACSLHGRRSATLAVEHDGVTVMRLCKEENIEHARTSKAL
jgi:hypothetical protein